MHPFALFAVTATGDHPVRFAQPCQAAPQIARSSPSSGASASSLRGSTTDSRGEGGVRVPSPTPASSWSNAASPKSTCVSRSPQPGGGLYARSAMLLSPAPDLPFVIGLPFGLLLVVCALGFAMYTVMGRIKPKLTSGSRSGRSRAAGRQQGDVEHKG